MKQGLILSLLLCVCFNTTTSAQKYLLVIKGNGKEMKRMSVGEPLRLKVRGEDTFHTSSIMQLDYDRNLVYLENWIVPLDSIEAIQSNSSRLSKQIGKVAIASGLPALFTSVMAGLFYKPANTKEFVIASGGLTLSGQILKWIGKRNRVYSIQKNYYFRLIDLTIQAPVYQEN